MSRIVILRTHYSDSSVESLIVALSAVADVIVVADESAGFVDIRNAPKISLTTRFTRDCGLFDGAPRIFWRCGDYALYAVRRMLPDAAFFWMIEPDVRLSVAKIEQFFDVFDACRTADFLAAGVRPAESDWDWAATLRGRVPVVWRCLFPLVRVSGAALDDLLERRRAESALFSGRDPAEWPNDEAFTASTLSQRGYQMADFNDFGDYYTEKTFSFWHPIRESVLSSRPPDGRLYHPVLSGHRYFEKLFYIAHCKGDFRELVTIIGDLVDQEWTAAEAIAHLQRIIAARTSPAVR